MMFWTRGDFDNLQESLKGHVAKASNPCVSIIVPHHKQTPTSPSWSRSISRKHARGPFSSGDKSDESSAHPTWKVRLQFLSVQMMTAPFVLLQITHF
jgi:hypothetical protein